MSCEKIRSRMLRCAPGELAGRGETQVARHVRACDACRQVAKALLAGQQDLARALDESAAGGDGRRGAERALDAAGIPDGAPGARWRSWIPLAAAALILLFLLPGGEERSGDTSPPADARPAVEDFGVDAAGEGLVTVLETSDPMVTVVWFHTDNERSDP